MSAGTAAAIGGAEADQQACERHEPGFVGHGLRETSSGNRLIDNGRGYQAEREGQGAQRIATDEGGQEPTRDSANAATR